MTTALTCTGTALALAAGGRLLAVTVALLARDPQRRADAREVLRLLLTHHRPTPHRPPPHRSPTATPRLTDHRPTRDPDRR